MQTHIFHPHKESLHDNGNSQGFNHGQFDEISCPSYRPSHRLLRQRGDRKCPTTLNYWHGGRSLTERLTAWVYLLFLLFKEE